MSESKKKRLEELLSEVRSMLVEEIGECQVDVRFKKSKEGEGEPVSYLEADDTYVIYTWVPAFWIGKINGESDDSLIIYPWCPEQLLEKFNDEVENTLKPGDKVRLKKEFKRYAGLSAYESCEKCGLCGVSRDEVLEIKSINNGVAEADFKHGRYAWCPVSWLEKVDDEAEDEPEVLAADGLPVKAGDLLWFVDDGCYEKTGIRRIAKQPFRVVRIDDGIVKANSSDETDGDLTWWIRPDFLTHTQLDTWERLEEDAKKRTFEYWGCEDIMCEECPEVVKKGRAMPKDRYGTVTCSEAKCIEILRRAKALADRERGE